MAIEFKDIALAIANATGRRGVNVQLTGEQLVSITSSLEDHFRMQEMQTPVPAWAVELLFGAVASDQDILAQMHAGRKIQAIKSVRAKFVGVSLSMAKDAVEGSVMADALTEYRKGLTETPKKSDEVKRLRAALQPGMDEGDIPFPDDDPQPLAEWEEELLHGNPWDQEPPF